MDSVSLNGSSGKDTLGSVRVSKDKYWIAGDSSDKTDVYDNGEMNNHGPVFPENDDGLLDPCLVRIDDKHTFIPSTESRNVYIYDWTTEEFTKFEDKLIVNMYGSVCGMAKTKSGQVKIVVASGHHFTRNVQVVNEFHIIQEINIWHISKHEK